ncbi:MAG: hypothetical protein B7X01_02690, partial [Acidiphilium sp. 21-62-4]
MSAPMTIFDTMLPILFLALAAMVMLMSGVFSRRDHSFAITGAAIVLFAITARLMFAAPDGT